MTTKKLRAAPFDPAEYLETPEEVAVYLDEAFATGDPAFIASALADAARARGLSMGGGNPDLATVLRLLADLGVRLEAKPAAPEAA